MANNLAQRASQSRTAASKKPATLADQVRSMESQFQLAMPKGAEAQQLVRDALTLLRATPKLAECEPSSVLGGLMTFAQLGLRPGSALGHAYLLPMWNGRNRRLEATPVIGYQGLIELAHRSGQIKSISARVVYENDEFHIEYGLNDDLIHRPVMDGDRGAPVAYYAVAKYVSGGYNFDVMTHREMEAHRDRFALAKNKQGQVVGPWKDNFEEMAKKTMIRRLAKVMPKSTDLATAIVADERVRVDLAPDAVEGEPIDGEYVETEASAGDGPTVVSLMDRMQAEGIEDDQRVAWVSQVVERDVDGLADLSVDEKQRVSAALDQMEKESKS